MATLTVECARGSVSVEADASEDSASIAKRLAEAMAAAGGRKGERVEKPRPLTRAEQMNARQLLECARCKMWLPPTKFAAERHNRKHHANAA